MHISLSFDSGQQQQQYEFGDTILNTTQSLNLKQIKQLRRDKSIKQLHAHLHRYRHTHT